MPTTEIVPSAIKIDKLIHRIEEGDIKIPAFQRGFVWNQAQVIDLLDSIYKDYPIGSVLLWNSLERLKSSRNVGGFLLSDREPDYPVNYVLDGQQRLSTIYAVFCTDRTQASDDHYDVDSSIFDICFDLDDQSFVPATELNADHKNISMNALLDLDAFFVAVEALSSDYRKQAQKLHSRFINYEVPIVTTYKRRKDEVGIIFERINNTGTKLTTLDLMVAWTWSEDFHLREEIDDLLENLEIKGFGDIPDKILLQALSAVIQENAKSKAILNLSAKQVRRDFPKLVDGLEKAIDFLSTELNVISRDFLPHAHQIVPLAFFFSQINTPSSQQCKVLKHWFWKTSFSRRYSAQTDDKLNADIAFFKDVANGDHSGIDDYTYTADGTLLVQQKFSKRHPFVRAFLLLLAQNNPLNLVNGSKIDLGEALSKYNRKEYHHIFPRAFLKKRELEIERINSLCNFCFLPADSNKIISRKEPQDYIFNVVPKDRYGEILTSNLMPLRKEIYQKNDYDKFLLQRAQLIIQFLDNQLV